MSNHICIASLTSQTYANKAQKCLSNAVIQSRIVKLNSDMNKNGCSYGIEFPCEQLKNVKNALENAGIKVKRYFHDGEEIDLYDNRY